MTAPAFVIPAAPAPNLPPPAPTAEPAAPAAKLDQLVGLYRDLRDKKKELATAAAALSKPVNDAMVELEAMILDALNRAGVESSRTKNGTAFISTRTSYTVQDPVVFRRWIEETQRLDLLETRVSKDTIESMLSAGEQLPPGIKVSSENTINVRK